MKKSSKLILTAVSLLAAPAVINHFIDLKFKRINNNYERNRFTYEYSFGEISYKKMGKGKPLLLVHGLSIGACSYEFEEAALRLSKYYKVYVLDLLGFGRSSKPGISYSAYLFTSLINDFITNVIKEPCFIAANANSADYAVMAYHLNNSNIKKMLLINPKGLNADNIKSKCFAGKYNFAKGDDRYKKLFAKLLNLPVYGTFAYNFLSSKINISYVLRENVFYNEDLISKTMINKIYESAHIGGSSNRYVAADLMGGKLDADISEKIREIPIPINLVLSGKENECVIKELMDLYSFNSSYELPGYNSEHFELTFFEEAKLMPHFEQPLKFARLCREFFE